MNSNFDGCHRACRRRGAHTMFWGGCENAIEPEPTVSLSRVDHTPGEDPSIRFDRYTAQGLANLIEPALREVQIRLGPNAISLLQHGETVGLSGGEYAALAQAAAQSIIDRCASGGAVSGSEHGPK